MIVLLQSDPDPGDAVGVDDEDAAAVGDFDEVVGLIGMSMALRTCMALDCWGRRR